jgi:signal transduction histidine kinase
VRPISAAKGNVGLKADVLQAPYSFERFIKSTLSASIAAARSKSAIRAFSGGIRQMNTMRPMPATETERPSRARGFGLASRVLTLLVFFLILAEVAIYVPSIANFRTNWLLTRLSAAYTAALVLEAAPKGMVPAELKRELLDSVGARMIVLQIGDARHLLAVSDMPPAIDATADLRSYSAWESIMAALVALVAPPGRIIDVKGPAPMGADFIEIAMDEAPLKAAMRDYSENIVLVSLFISAIVATCAALAIHVMVLRPVRRLTSNLMAFAERPEDASRIIVPSRRTHEIGQAEQALAAMESALARELKEKKHLAALGLAVAKISHELRNMLASAQLLSDRLADLHDPLAKRLAPKLIATLDRAIRFCQATLAYGRAAEEVPKLQRISLHKLVTEAVEAAVPGQSGIEAINDVPREMKVTADKEQMFRVLLNLCRNAVEALDGTRDDLDTPPRLRLSARREARKVLIDVADSGPGVPAAARARLFEPFQASARSGGSGLGLAIAADLVRAHGGQIRLLENGDSAGLCGAVFEVSLPEPDHDH